MRQQRPVAVHAVAMGTQFVEIRQQHFKGVDGLYCCHTSEKTRRHVAVSQSQIFQYMELPAIGHLFCQSHATATVTFFRSNPSFENGGPGVHAYPAGACAALDGQTTPEAIVLLPLPALQLVSLTAGNSPLFRAPGQRRDRALRALAGGTVLLHPQVVPASAAIGPCD